MNLIKKLCDACFNEQEVPEEEKDSFKYRMQSEKCLKLYDELYGTLNEGQRKTLSNLDIERFILAGIWKDESFKEGSEKGFKLAIRLLLEV